VGFLVCACAQKPTPFMAATDTLCDRLLRRMVHACLPPEAASRWLQTLDSVLPVLRDDTRLAALAEPAAFDAFLADLRSGCVEPTAPVNAYAVHRVNGKLCAFPLRGLPLDCLPTHPGDAECRLGNGLGVWCQMRFVPLQQWLVFQKRVDLERLELINLAALRMLHDADLLDCTAVAVDAVTEPQLCMNVPVGPAILYRLKPNHTVSTAHYDWDTFVADWTLRFSQTRLLHTPLRLKDERAYIYNSAVDPRAYDAVPFLSLDGSATGTPLEDTSGASLRFDYEKIADERRHRGHTASAGFHRRCDLDLARTFIGRVMVGRGWPFDWDCYAIPLPDLHPLPVRLIFKGKRPLRSNAPSPALKRHVHEPPLAALA
jgi:hypothetical protein